MAHELDVDPVARLHQLQLDLAVLRQVPLRVFDALGAVLVHVLEVGEVLRD